MKCVARITVRGLLVAVNFLPFKEDDYCSFCHHFPLNVRPHNQVTGVKFVSVLESLFLPFCLTPSSSLYFPSFFSCLFSNDNFLPDTWKPSQVYYTSRSFPGTQGVLSYVCVTRGIKWREREREQLTALGDSNCPSLCVERRRCSFGINILGDTSFLTCMGKRRTKQKETTEMLISWRDRMNEKTFSLSLGWLFAQHPRPRARVSPYLSHLPPHLFIPHRHPLFSPYLLSLSLFDSRFTDLIKLMRW